LKKWPLGEKGKWTQKRLLWGVIGLAALILVYNFGVVALVEAKKRADEEIALKQRILLKYAEILQNRKGIEESIERTQKQSEEIQKRLLPGETPQLGAAHLQDIVKRLAEKNRIALRSFRILEPKEVSFFQRIALQIDFNPISSITSLGQFLFDLENQEKELMISEMDLLVFNPRMPNTVQGNVVISGLMKGSKGVEKGGGK